MVIIEKINIKNFRNIKEATFSPDRKVNFLVGQNAQGKTSFIEALGYLSSLRSFRESKNHQIIQHDSYKSEVSCVLIPETDNEWKTHLKLELEIQKIYNPGESFKKPHVTKRASINGKHYSSSTQYLSQRFSQYHLGFHSIVFNPSDHDLVRGDPSARRSYLDRVLCSQDVDYLKNLQKYQRVLEQRNALLKEERLSLESLLSFTQTLCKYGSWIVFKRLEWVKNTLPEFQDLLQVITHDRKKIEISYISDWACESKCFFGQEDLPSVEILEQNFMKRISSVQASERNLGYTLAGPHRDDWMFLLDGEALKGHGSQGETRSALVALKLSEVYLFRKKTGHRPLFLLDDFSSELDKERRGFLFDYLMQTDLQTFITTTEDLGFQGKLFTVSEGQIREEGLYDYRTKIA